MKIILIRHADPDYQNDTLTEKGFLEAQALSKLYNDDDFDIVYSSPLPRALLTCRAVIKHKPINIAPWAIEFMRETSFQGKIYGNYDFLPSFTEKHHQLIEDNFLDHPLMESADIKKEMKTVISNFDLILENNGYVRENENYRVTQSNTKTIVLFCHAGLMNVITSHLFNIPFVKLMQYSICPPTGVTTFISEEREKGKAIFRMVGYGDVSHLIKENLKPSFSGRFCEYFESKERH